MPQVNFRKYKDLFGSVLSAACLILAFPQTDWGGLAWIALVPLMGVLDGKKPRAAFGWGYFCGILFFAGTLYWFIHVTVLGAVLLILYLSLYIGLFGLGYNFFRNHPPLIKLFVLPGVWTALEFIRAHLFTGFGWAGLGYSQYKNLPLIQIADVAGVFGVSFLVVMVNVFWKETFPLFFHSGGAYRKGRFYAALMTCILLSILGYGMFRLKTVETADAASAAAGEMVSVAVIQADIPQEMKWFDPAWPDILKRYMILTRAAVKEKPDLIIWPETSYPGILWEDTELWEELKDFVRRQKVPLLVGAVTKEAGDYYNSAILLSGQGEAVRQYRKIHLVPFGEYIPLRRLFPFLSRIVPIADFTPGKEFTLFPFSGAAGAALNHFSVLICFEDTVSGLGSKFSKNGAGLFINITNDAWFADTKAPFLHLQSSVFRAVENRRGLVRAANTGVSGFIDASGRLIKAVKDARGKMTYVEGYAAAPVSFRREETFYAKFGDIFTFGCFGCILWGIARKLN